jgi:hypothetical protein
MASRNSAWRNLETLWTSVIQHPRRDYYSLDAQNFSLFQDIRVSSFLSGPWDENLVPCKVTAGSMILTVLGLVSIRRTYAHYDRPTEMRQLWSQKE